MHNLKQIIIFACGNQNIEEYGESFYHNWIHQAKLLLLLLLKKHNLRSASSVQSAIKKLMEYHLVTTSQATYYIDDQLMELWLKM